MNLVVVFRRVHERGYAVEVRRYGFPDLEMNPAPGYDQLIPHDLMHMVVEAQLGISRAVFGQLALGGDAGTFHPVFRNNEKTREIARVRTHVKDRGKKLLREGRDDCAQSERATYICWQYWLAHAQSADRKATSQSMSQQAKEVRDVASARELGALNRSKLDEICKHLDELSSVWSQLEVGQSMAVRWPDLAVSTDPEDFSS
ncbi:MAG TPA: hypothetical protein VJP89_00670 [Pyrinomonadaceae bacterium]|nr:hypothetical protein [Pyrinomonadaceae bacterium]